MRATGSLSATYWLCPVPFFLTVKSMAMIMPERSQHEQSRTKPLIDIVNNMSHECRVVHNMST